MLLADAVLVLHLVLFLLSTEMICLEYMSVVIHFLFHVFSMKIEQPYNY